MQKEMLEKCVAKKNNGCNLCLKERYECIYKGYFWLKTVVLFITKSIISSSDVYLLCRQIHMSYVSQLIRLVTGKQNHFLHNQSNP